MDKRKKLGSKKIAVLVIVIVLVFALLFSLVASLSNGEAKAGGTQGIPADNTQMQESDGVPVEQLDKTGNAAKYMTVSQDDNIDIGVNYLNPVTGDMGTLTFDVIIGTHSVDLAQYADIRKYVELRTDTGVVISDGFEWIPEDNGSHHISGALKLKNNFEGKPIVDSNTKSFRVIFKNVGSAGEREHVYEGDKLK